MRTMPWNVGHSTGGAGRGVAVLATGVLAAAGGAALGQQAWVPVWADEFDGTSLNAANWEYQIGTGSLYGLDNWGNNELQYYTSRTQNLTVGGGLLTITARAESYMGRNYTSARIRTQGRREFLHGRIEARIKPPAGQGLWPAFWMLPTNSPYGGWAASGEIDVMETVNAATTVHGTIHHGGGWPANVSSGGQRAGAWSEAFHTYVVEWEPDEIRWYVDGVRYYRVTSATWYSTAAPGNVRAPFDSPFHLLLNLAVGGNWPGNPNGSTPFPAHLQVDYVRVSQRPPKGPYGGVAPVLPARIEAEFYDVGGGSVAYSDNDPENVGGALRTQEAVDIQVCAEGGHNVGWYQPGEWMEYTINVPRAGVYQARVRAATPNAGASVRLFSGATPLANAMSVAPTGGWQVYRTVRADVTLSEGVQSLRLTNTGTTDVNINWIELVMPGDVNGDGRVTVDDLYVFESGLGAFRDVDGDGTPGTVFDWITLIALVRATERADLTPPH